MKKNSRVLFFRCIHPLNLPLALLASFILRIIYWKTERVSTRWLNRFEVLDPADYFSREEYTTLLNKNYDIKVLRPNTPMLRGILNPSKFHIKIPLFPGIFIKFQI